MVLGNPYMQYKENSVFTASPEELTLMLYNGLVRFIMQGQMAIDENDILKAHNSIISAQNIITELRSTLDMSYEISNAFDMLYEYMHTRLIEANIKKDKSILDEVLGFAKEFRDVWAQAMKLAKRSKNSEAKIAK